MNISELLGKPLVSADSGERVGRIDDVLLDSEHRRVVGVLVTEGTFSKQRVLPFDEIQTAGLDTVIAKTVSTLCDARDWLHDGRPAHRSRSLIGKDVITSEGTRLGSVHGLVAEENSGRIVALEIAAGRHAPPSATMVHATGDLQLTNDVVVVPAIAGDSASRP